MGENATKIKPGATDAADGDDRSPQVRNWLSNLQLLVTVITAVLGMYLNCQQQKLNAKQQELANTQQDIKNKQEKVALQSRTRAETATFVEKTLAYVEGKLAIADRKQREAIVIDLLDDYALASASDSGSTDPHKVVLIPLWIALATGNVEALGLIGNSDGKREAWYKLALASGDPIVRKTAMEALARSGASRPLECLLEIFELSEQMNNLEILEGAVQQLGRVVRVMERHADPAQFREDDRIKPVVVRLEALRTSLAASAVAGTAADGRISETSLRTAEGVEHVLAFLRGDDLSRDLRSVKALTETAPSPQEVKALIADLKSPETEKRRQSRRALASAGDTRTTVDSLLEELKRDSSKYELRIGVASTLYQTRRPVVIGDADSARRLVALLGDEDVLVRKYAAEALMKFTDHGTVKLLHGEMSTVIRNRKREPRNGVYNSVVVLGTWLRILPDSLGGEKSDIRQELTTLRSQLQNEAEWKRTAGLIGEVLSLSSRDTVATRAQR